MLETILNHLEAANKCLKLDEHYYIGAGDQKICIEKWYYVKDGSDYCHCMESREYLDVIACQKLLGEKLMVLKELANSTVDVVESIENSSVMLHNQLKEVTTMELNAKTIKWLQDFAQNAISEGFRNHFERVDEDTCKDLLYHGLIQRHRGNDGDYPWHGKVQLTPEWSGALHGKLEVFRNIRELFAEGSTTMETKPILVWEYDKAPKEFQQSVHGAPVYVFLVPKGVPLPKIMDDGNILASRGVMDYDGESYKVYILGN